MIIFIFVSGLSRLLPFLLTPVFTHYLAPQDMGQLELVLALYNIYMVFGMCQLDTSLQRYYHSSNCIPKSTVIGVIKLSILATLVFYISIPLTAKILSLGNNAYSVLSVAGASIIFANLHVLNSLIIRYSRPIKFVIFVNALQTTLFASLAFIAIVKLKLGIIGYFQALLISYVISVLISSLIIKKQLSEKLNGIESAKIWTFALPQMPARIASVIAQYGNRFVLYTIFSQTTIGIFAVASKISTLMLIGLSAFCMVWYPLLYEKNQSTVLKNIPKIFKLVITIMPIVVLTLFGLSAFIFKNYISKSYVQAEMPTYIMIVAASLLIIKEMVDAGIKISERVKYISYIYISNTILLFVLMIAAGSIWGLIGVAYAMFLSNIVLTYSTWLVAEKLHPMNFDMRYCHIYVTFCFLIVLALQLWM